MANGEWRMANGEGGRFGAARLTPFALRPVFVPVRVDLLVLLPLPRDRLLGEDRGHGTGRLTVSALNADVRIDVEHLRGGEVRLVLARMDAIHRANVDAGRVLRSDA